MKAVVQRVKKASVTVDGQTISSIGPGLLTLLGVAQGDTEDQLKKQ
jgi:D-tyrosyl-tRNA(Tyr) deacylase